MMETFVGYVFSVGPKTFWVEIFNDLKPEQYMEAEIPISRLSRMERKKLVEGAYVYWHIHDNKKNHLYFGSKATQEERLKMEAWFYEVMNQMGVYDEEVYDNLDGESDSSGGEEVLDRSKTS